MKKTIVLYTLIFISLVNSSFAGDSIQPDTSNNQLMDISQQLLLAAKTKGPTDSLVTILQSIAPGELQKQIVTDDQKKAFWINMYNAFTQIILSKNPDQYKKRNSFFGSKQIIIACQKLKPR